METLLSFLIAGMITMWFVRRYLKGNAVARPAVARAPVAAPSGPPCPRCARPVPSGAAFCAACGAPMALWTTHRSPVQKAQPEGAPQGKGKPKPVISATLCIGCGSCVDVCPESGTLEVVGGKAVLAHPDRCTGHAACVGACPTSAITLAFGGVLQTLRVPLVNETFESNVPGLYIAGELGGMGLIKTAINEGRLAMDHVLERLKAEPQPASEDIYDVLIVGAGPAGLSASLVAQQNEIRYITLEQGEIASTIRQYPRHKFLMAEPLEMPLYGSLYIADSTKESLLAVWETIIANTGVQVRTNTKVESLVRQDGVFRVASSQGEFLARYVILATGKRGTPRKLGAPGEELPKLAYRLIEAGDYEDVDALVVGGGDSAIEAALALSRSGKNRVTLSYRGAAFDRARDRNRAQLEEAESKGAITVLRSSQVKAIREDTVDLACGGETRTLPNHYVFVLIGGESPETFLQKIGVEIVERARAA